MGSVDKGLVTKLQDAGQRLALLPTDVNELLPLLDYLEDLLSSVEQSPPDIIQKAYAPSIKALLEEPLLRHSDADVRVAIASCISEITRITAPEAPYNDEQMKDVFELIVSSFENLADKNSRSYSKRASILETVAKVRSCVVMLDLECDNLIIEMFQHFLRSIRDYHPQNVFTSMETIMTLVLDESEDISLELLEPILTILKEENEKIPTIARKLGEKVFENCADKIKPYLAQAVKSLGVPLEDYSKVVVSLCNERSDAVENNAVNVSGELAEEKKLPSSDGADQLDSKLLTASSHEKIKEVKEQAMEEAVPEEVQPEAERSPQSVMSNGVIETGNEGISVLPESLKKPDGSDFSSEPLDVNTTNIMNTDDSDVVKSVKQESKADETDNIKEKDSNFAIHSTEPSDSSHVDEEKEVETSCLKMNEEAADKLPGPEKSGNQNVDTGASSETVKELVAKTSSLEALDNKVGAVASSSPSKSVLDESLPNKSDESKKEDGQEDEPSIESVPPKIADGTGDSEAKPLRSLGENKEKSSQDDAPNVDLVNEKGTDVTSASEVKAPTGSAKKLENLPQEVSPSVDAASAKVADRTSDSEVKTKRRSGKKNKDLVEEETPSAKTVKTADAISNLPVKVPRSLGKKKEKRTREDPLSADPTSPLRVTDVIKDSNIKRQKRSGTKTTARITKEENMVAGGGVSKTAGDDTTSDSEAKSLRQKAKKEGSDLEEKAVKKSGKQEEKSDLEEKAGKKSGKQGETSDSEEKAVKKSGKQGETSDSKEKAVKKSGKQGETSRTKGKPQKQTAGKVDASDSEAMTSKQASKKDDTSSKGIVSSKKGDAKKPGRGKDTSERDSVKDSVNDDDREIVSSPKSTSKPVKEDDHVDDPKMISKGKQTTPGKDKGMLSFSEKKASGNLEYGEILVGSKIKVWWPKDKVFYEGEVTSFDPQKKKHKVSYTDGDEEILCLQRQRWEFIDGKIEEPEEDEDSNHESAKTHKKKKAKTNPEQLAKQHDVSPKRAGASSSKGKKRKATKNLVKSDGESDEELLKPVKRSKGADGGKSKTTEKSKEETPKAGTKTKSKSPTTGIKANGLGKGKSALPKEKEAETKKGKSSESSRTPDTSKGQASENKSGKKRRRGSRG